jgi:hypothetical protein
MHLRIKISLVCLIIVQFSFAQNVGINTVAPQARLHIFKGSSGYIGAYPHQDLIIESNDHAWINLLAPNNKEMGLLFGKPSSIASGGIVYDINNNMHFRTNGNINRMFIGSNGNIGIGTTTPNAPLSFPAVLGSKITLYPGASGNVGFGVQGNLFQMFSDYAGADIAFGYGTSSNFIERMRVKGNGNVGIGTTTPTQKLDIDGSIRISGSYYYSSPETFYYSIPQAAFTSEFGDQYIVYKEGTGASMRAHDYAMTAAVNLPHHATITQVRVKYQDDASYGDLVFDLSRRYLGGNKELMGSYTSSGIGNTIGVISSITNPFIDNANYNYHISIYTNPVNKWDDGYNLFLLRVEGIFITYTLTAAQ